VKTVAHLSDLHFGRLDEAVLDPLRLALERLHPDLVVISGDLTQRARKGQFRDAKEYLDSLPMPQIVVPGNHDVPLYNVVKRFLAPLKNYREIISDDLQPDYIDDEIAVVGVNTARSFVFKGGRINDEQVEAVKAKLCGLPDGITKILVTHHPFDVPKDSGEGDQIVGRARMALEKLAGCGADLLLSGHLHDAHVGHTAERYPIAGVSALVVQAGTATSSRTRETPNSFNVLRVESNHVVVEQHAWDEGDFRPKGVQDFVHDLQGWHASGAGHAGG
jgi:3',5'-cyclic AMP phosphodiesterase CpdA